jgi:uncharacterized protein (DUF2062 family)
MTFRRALRYHWLKFLRLQEDPKKLAWGMALGVFIGVTPTVPFHTVAALTLATLLGISPVTAFLGIQICNPLTLPAFYLAAYKVGQYLLYQGVPLRFPDPYTYKALLHLLWRGGLALQLGGLVLALPPAVVSYFLTLWVVQRYRQRKAQRAASVPGLSQNHSSPPGPEA